MRTAAVLLAAGRGNRFDGPSPKLLAELDGKPLIRWAIESAQAAGIGDIYVVVGGAELAGTLAGTRVVPNSDWEDGLATSLCAGIEAARLDGHREVVVALADQPAIAPQSWRAVAAADATAISIATYEGVRGHPVRLAAEVWDELPRTGDGGARTLMRDRPELVTEVPCTSGNALDVDTAEDLVRFNSRTHSA